MCSLVSCYARLGGCSRSRDKKSTVAHPMRIGRPQAKPPSSAKVEAQPYLGVALQGCHVPHYNCHLGRVRFTL